METTQSTGSSGDPRPEELEHIANTTRTLCEQMHAMKQHEAQALIISNATGIALITHVALETQSSTGPKCGFMLPVLAFAVGAIAGLVHFSMIAEMTRLMYAHYDSQWKKLIRREQTFRQIEWFKKDEGYMRWGGRLQRTAVVALAVGTVLGLMAVYS